MNARRHEADPPCAGIATTATGRSTALIDINGMGLQRPKLNPLTVDRHMS